VGFFGINLESMLYSDVQYLSKLSPAQAAAAQSAILRTKVTPSTYPFWAGLFTALTPGEVWGDGHRPIDIAFDARTLDKTAFDSIVERVYELRAAQTDRDLQMLFLEIATHLKAEYPDAMGEIPGHAFPTSRD
jgi:hypothetical protein